MPEIFKKNIEELIEELIEKYQNWERPQNDTSRMYWSGEYNELYDKITKEILKDLEKIKTLVD